MASRFTHKIMPSVTPSAAALERRRIRSSPEYAAARAAYRLVAEQSQLPCWLDGEPIDYSLPRDHPDAWSLDHAIPMSDPIRGIALALDPNNFRSAHLACNKRRGNNEPHIPIGKPSRVW
jgi:hypothetical protein